MRKLLLTFCMLASIFGMAQKPNIAPNATVTADGAGGGGCRSGACSTLNDLIFGTCGSQEMWVSTTPPNPVGVDFIEWNWPTAQAFDEMTIHHGDPDKRTLTGFLMQYWDGTQWVNGETISNLPQQCINTVSFQRLVTSRMRITSFQMNASGQQSNPNFREIEIFQASTSDDDAGVTAATPLSGVCNGSYPVEVLVQNFGLNQIDSVEVHWEINGVAQPFLNYNSQLDTIGGTGSSNALISLGNYTFNTNQTYDLKAWTALPNSSVDTSNFNDTLNVQLMLTAPGGLAVNNIMPTTADVIWTATGATSYEAIYGPPGFNPANSGSSVSSSTSPASLSSLAPGTDYEVYLVADCGSGNYSDTTGPVSFATLCVLKTLPYVEDFTGGAFPNCWSRSSTSDVTVLSSCDTRSDVLEILQTEDATTADIDVSGVLNQNLEVSYYIGAGACNNDPEDEDFIVEYWDGSQWVEALRHNGDILPNAFVRQTFFVPAGQFGQPFKVRFNMLEGTTDTWQVDSVVVEQGPACLTPTQNQISFTNIGASQATVFIGDSLSNFEYEYGPCGFSQGTGTVGSDSATAVISGLADDNCYDVYLRRDCGTSGFSPWAGPFSFTTLCTLKSLPYVQDFSGGIFPNCWSRSSTSDVTYLASCSSRSDVLEILQTADATTADIDVSSIMNQNLEVSYYIGAGACDNDPEDEDFIVEYWDGSQWVEALRHNGDILPNAFVRQTFFVPAGQFGQPFKVRFNMLEGTTDTWQVDSVVVKQGPACLRPTQNQVVFSNIKSDQTTVFIGDSLSNFDYEWGPCGFSQGTGTFGTGSMGTDTATGMSPSTCYDFYIRRDCGPDGLSAWSGPFSVVTACGAKTAPYFNDFESDALDVPPMCWEGYATYSAAFVEVEDYTGTAAPYGGSQGLYLYSSSSSTTPGQDTLVAISPQFSDLTAGDKRVNFFANSDAAVSELIVGTASGADFTLASFTPLDTINFPTADTYQQVIVNITAANGYNGTDEYIVLKHSLGGTADYIRIDDFNYQTIPACVPPLGNSLGVVTTTSSSATVYWGAGSQGQKTYVEIGPAGFTPGMGTYIALDSVAGSVDTTTLSGLSPQTMYEFYVQDSCAGDGLSPWIGPVSFTTPCLASSLPYFEDFSSGVFPICWTRSNTTDVTIETTCDTRTNVIDINYTEEALTPIIDVSSATSLKVSYLIGAGACINDPEDNEHFYVEYWDGAQWVLANDHDGSLPQSFVSQSFLVPGGGFSSNFQVRFNMIDGTTDAWQIDSVVVEQGPTCVSPVQLSAANISDTSAVLNWDTATSANSYQIWFGPQGFYQGTQTAGAAQSFVTGTSFTVDTLSGNSCYEFLVRAICGPNDTSGWAGPFTFCTPCSAKQAPYYENFDNVATGISGDLGNCWTTSDLTYDWQTNSGTTTSTNTGPTGDATTGSGIYLYTEASSGAQGDTAILLSPLVDMTALSTPELRFSYHMYGSDIDTLHIDVNDGSGWIEDVFTLGGQQQTSNGAAWRDTSVSLSAFSGTIRVKFRAVRGASFDGDISVDEVFFDDPVSCPAPYNLSTSALLDTSATLAWVDSATTGSYQVWFGPQGFYQGPSTLGGTKVMSSTNSLLLDTLSPQTCYEFLVRSICGPGDSSFFEGPNTFCTGLGFDAAIDAIVVPSGCGDSTTTVEVAFTNNGIYPIMSLPVAVVVSGDINTTLNATYTGNLAMGNSDTVLLGTLNTYAGANLNLAATISLANDQVSANDALSDSVSFANASAVQPIAARDTLCGSGLFDTLYFPSDPGSYYWVSTNNDTIGSSDSLVVGPLSANDTTFLLRSEGSVSYNVGPVDNTLGAGGNYTFLSDGPVFTVQNQVTLDVVYVYPGGAGNVVVNLYDGNSTLLQTITYAVPASAAGVKTAVPLGFSLAPGSYEMDATGTTTGGLYRNTGGAVYPYSIPGVLDITGPINALAGYYYFFYDWEVSSGGCSRPDGSVTIYNSGMGVASSFTSSLGSPTATDLTVSFDASATTGATTYSWDFGDGTTGNGVTTQHAYTKDSTYIVTLVASGPCGTDTITDTVVVAGVSLADNPLGRSLSLYPNPASDKVTLSFTVSGSQEAVIRILDMTGKEVMHFTEANHNGRFEGTIDVSPLADGVYMLQVADGENQAVRRLIKE